MGRLRAECECARFIDEAVEARRGRGVSVGPRARGSPLSAAARNGGSRRQPLSLSPEGSRPVSRTSFSADLTAAPGFSGSARGAPRLGTQETRDTLSARTPSPPCPTAALPRCSRENGPGTGLVGRGSVPRVDVPVAASPGAVTGTGSRGRGQRRSQAHPSEYVQRGPPGTTLAAVLRCPWPWRWGAAPARPP